MIILLNMSLVMFVDEIQLWATIYEIVKKYIRTIIVGNATQLRDGGFLLPSAFSPTN